MTFEFNSPSGGSSPTPSLRDSGAALLREGRFTEAANLLTDAVEMDPQDEGAWRLLGGALASTGNYERAVPAFERAINLAPDNARNYYNVALAYQATQRMADARTAVTKSVSLDSTYAPAQQLLQTMGGAPASAPVAPPTPSSLRMGLGGNLNSPIAPIPTPAAPSDAPLPSAPSGSPSGMSGLGAIGGGTPGGLGAIGGGQTPASTAPPSNSLSGVGSASGGLASVGGGGAPYGSPAGAPPSYMPQPGMQPGGYVPPQGYAPTPVLGPGGTIIEQPNTSGTDGPPPPGATGGWNWGAFLFSWIWLLAHRYVLWGLLLLGGAVVVQVLQYAAHVRFLGLILFGIQIYLGINGNRLGWQGRRFDSVEDFRACQRIWGWWALGVFLFEVVAIFAFSAFIFAAIMGREGGMGTIGR